MPKRFFIITSMIVFFLLKTTLPCHANVLVVHDNYCAHGLFSCFQTVIGVLNHYDLGNCTGVEIDYQDKGFYYEPSKGLNWWTYYFKPLNFSKFKNAKREVLSSDLHIHFNLNTTHNLPIERINYIIRKYIRINKDIKDEIKRFVNKNFKDNIVIGVHYRGTDKSTESPRLEYSAMRDAITKELQKYENSSVLIFLATDEEALLTYLKNEFPGQIICLDAIRSTNSVAVHIGATENYRKGKEAVMDCLLLAQCDSLVRTSSNLSLCSTYFNPNLPVQLLNPGFYD